MNNKGHTHCIECEIALRGKRQTIADHPGTRLHAGKGKCSACAQRGYKSPPRDPAPTVVSFIELTRDRPTATQLVMERDWLAASRRRRGIPPEGLLTGRTPIKTLVAAL